MRNLILTILLVASCYNLSYAQTATQKGKTSIGGYAKIRLYSNASDGNANSVFGALFQFNATKFLDDNLAIGVQTSRIQESNLNGSSANAFKIGPQIDYYHFFTDELAFRAAGSLFYARRGHSNSLISYHGAGFMANPGIAYFIKDRIAIQAAISLEWQSLNQRITPDYKINNRYFNFELPLIGMAVHF